MAQRGVTLGASAVGVAVLASLLGACGVVTTQKYVDDAKVDGPVRAIRIATGAGSVRVRAGAVTTVRRTVSYLDSRPGVTHHVEGDVLVLQDCAQRNCWVDYEVVAPEGVTVSGAVDSGSVDVEGASTVNVRADSGEVAVHRASGAVNVVADSGRVDLVDVGGRVAVQAGSGDISAKNVGDATLRAESGSVDAAVNGSVDVNAQSGDVTLRLAKVAAITAVTDNGSVDVVVPRGRYRVDAHAGSGTVDNAIGDDHDADTRLDLRADSGDVSVRFG